MVYNKNISFTSSLLLSALLVISGPVSAFDLGKLKDLAEQLQKNMPFYTMGKSLLNVLSLKVRNLRRILSSSLLLEKKTLL
mgnify:CR=1 FL=1